MKFLIWVITLMFLTGCSPTKHIYREIQKDKETYNIREYNADKMRLNNAIIETLLGKKFVIDHEDAVSGTITAKRFFSKSYQTVAVVVQTKILTQDENNHKLFLNGIQTTERNYVADRTRFFLWIVPLPGGGGKEVSKSKESEIIIEDKTFYDDLFNSIQAKLDLKLVDLKDNVVDLNPPD